MAPCRRCETDLLHCHGTLVRHGEGEVECSDPRCAGRLAVHDFVIVCDDVQSGCCRGRTTAHGRVRRRRAVVRSA
jgi:hypothetical protein